MRRDGAKERVRFSPAQTASGVTAALKPASFCGPVHKPLHVVTVFPRELKEFAGSQVGAFLAEERFKAPAHIRALPGLQPIASRGVPIVVQSLKHFLRP